MWRLMYECLTWAGVEDPSDSGEEEEEEEEAEEDSEEEEEEEGGDESDQDSKEDADVPGERLTVYCISNFRFQFI